MEEKDLQKDFLSLTNKLWKFKSFDERETENISQNFGFSYLLAKLFNIRNINITDIDQYINPSLKDNMPDPYNLVDIYLGVGGAPEGVLAAAALQCIGGQMQARLVINNDDERSRAQKIGIEDLDKKYSLDELAHGDIIFSATGVTEGTMVRGVRNVNANHITHSLVLRSNDSSTQYIETYHNIK